MLILWQLRNGLIYCAFVDFKMAFNSIDRCKLRYKIAKIGIRGKLLSILKICIVM